jgi:hypothetical protein
MNASERGLVKDVKNGLAKIRYGAFRLTKHKFLGWQVSRKFATQPFEFSLLWNHKAHHAGISFTFGIYKLFWLELVIYDNRHWDFDNNTWRNHDGQA